MFYYEKYGQDDSNSEPEDERDAFGNRHNIEFDFTNAPEYTIGDLFSYMGLSTPRDIAEASVTSITRVLYFMEKLRQKKIMERWVRSVYDKDTGRWKLCSAEKKETTLNRCLARYAAGSDDTYSNDYTDDYIIVESDTFLGWTEVE